jgi:hypothetical protein
VSRKTGGEFLAVHSSTPKPPDVHASSLARSVTVTSWGGLIEARHCLAAICDDRDLKRPGPREQAEGWYGRQEHDRVRPYCTRSGRP